MVLWGVIMDTWGLGGAGIGAVSGGFSAPLIDVPMELGVWREGSPWTREEVLLGYVPPTTQRGRGGRGSLAATSAILHGFCRGCMFDEER